MKKLFFFLSMLEFAFANSNIWGEGRITNITKYEDGFAPLFVKLQGSDFFALLAACAISATIFAFVVHFAIIGPKKFSHDGKKIYAFSVFTRLVHLLAAVTWIVLIPTGLVMMFGSSFGGGFFVRLCKNLHGIATVGFIISVIPMFIIFVLRMFPTLYDIKWMIIVGGYLSKEKKPIPAGKFNAGQKMWFWIATLGGLVMILTGGAMYFLDFKAPLVNEILGLSQIEILRLSAIIHNILGAACAVMFLVHVYMASIAIKGAIHSMVNGYKEEEEVEILHSYWYKELKEKGEI